MKTKRAARRERGRFRAERDLKMRSREWLPINPCYDPSIEGLTLVPGRTYVISGVNGLDEFQCIGK